MNKAERARAKQERWPSEFKPNPDYEYELPQIVEIDGRRCLEVDAGFITWADSLHRFPSKRDRG